jgi:FtsZ-binding cell division protein ZapB
MSAVINGGVIYTSVASMIMSNLYLTGATGQTGGVSNSNNSSNNVYCNNVYALSAVYANNVALTSDYRIKENVVPLGSHFKVDYLNPITYTNKRTNKQDIGLIAHELQEYYPELVTGVKDGTETQSVNYIGLIPVLIHEIKNLKNDNKSLQNKTTSLENEIQNIKNEIDVIKNKI